MLILTFQEFNNKFNIDNNAMSYIRIKDIGKDISLTPIEIVMEMRLQIVSVKRLHRSGNLTSTLL